jgi:hypothetical protein
MMFRRGTAVRWIGVAGACFASLGAAGVSHAAPPTTFDPVVEAKNFSITQERQAIYDTPQYQAQLAEQSALNGTEALAAGRS